MAEVSREITELKQRLDELGSVDEVSLGELTERRERLEQLQAAIRRVTAEQLELEAEISKVRDREARLSGDLKKTEGQIGVLESASLRHRERNELIRKTLAASPVSTIGLLEDLIETPSHVAAAFDALLSEYGPIVVVSDADAAFSCFDVLAENIPGRFSVLVAEGRPGSRGERSEGGGHTSGGDAGRSHAGLRGVVGRAIELVECPDGVRESLREILGDSVIVESSDAVRGAGIGRDLNLTIVTHDGSVISKRGVLKRGKPADAGAFGVDTELAERRNQFAEIEKEVSDCVSARCELEKRKVDLEERGSAAGVELGSLRDSIAVVENGISGHRAEAKVTESRVRFLEQRRQELQARLAVLREDSRRLEEEISQIRGSVTPLGEEPENATSLLRESEQQRDAAMRELNELRLSEVKQVSRKGELGSVIVRLEEERAQLQEEIVRKRTWLEQTRFVLGQGDDELAGLEAEVTQIGQVRSERDGKLESARSAYVSLRQEIEEIERRIREERRVLEGLSQESHALELSLTKHRIEREGVARRVHSQYGADVTAEPSPPEEFNSIEAEQKLGILREKMRNLGPVNLLALEEYERKRERLDFIKGQRDDLLEAKSSLLEVITKINEKASTMFLETFNEVQGRFQDTFRTLFEGGDAELRLVGDDPLEAEIEIVARPKGKKLEGLNLLSGGERALTAIALLFGIYLVKPSPFCILDEVDAPLDDANINRFVSMLKKFNERTQFIVITHNKRTMAAADCLYGITMQEPGVSKVVSVRLTGTEKAAQYSEEEVPVTA
ncbi:MAG: hypothetical protein V2A71_05805 [Candidatus Eisenbacteria bacterium]